MAGTSNHGSLMEDWLHLPPTPSPRTLMSSFLNEEFGSGPFANHLGDRSGNNPQDQSGNNKEIVGFREEGPTQSANFTFQKNVSLEPNLFDNNQKSNSHGGLAERRAARAGFSIPKIDTTRAGSSTVIRSPVSIPPGLSPTTLLESPVFLYNAMAQPSPTTGTLPFMMASNANSTIPPAAKMNEDCTFGDDMFSFQTPLGLKAPNFLTAEKGYIACHQNQSLSNNQQQESSQSSFTAIKDTTDETIVKPKTSDSMFGDNHASSGELEDDETNQNGEYTSAPIGTPAEDGYNWRKYGQKQVKNSEHPRSYYKCTHPNCNVKKKVERAEDGQITEIIYKGTHNHPLPPPNRRPGIPFSHTNDLEVNVLENPSSQAGLSSASLWENAKSGCLQDVQREGIEARQAGPVSTNGDTSMVESQDAVDASSTLSNDDDDRATRGSISIDCDGDGDETDSKRRKLDALATATATITTTTTSNIDMGLAASRAVREPRVVVQTTSEVDILDDGYRWRKYGQKVVKGNPNPRSYYKCTHPGCSVRKHVERASHDLKSVITTYEGKHNHEVPAARNSGHGSSGSGSAPQSAPQANNSQRRQESAQGSFGQFGGASPFSSFVLPPRSQMGSVAGNFRFGMVPPGMSFPMSGNSSTMQGYPGFVMPEGGLKTEPLSQSGFPAVNQTSQAFQQMMSRPPYGPQM